MGCGWGGFAPTEAPIGPGAGLTCGSTGRVRVGGGVAAAAGLDMPAARLHPRRCRLTRRLLSRRVAALSPQAAAAAGDALGFDARACPLPKIWPIWPKVDGLRPWACRGALSTRAALPALYRCPAAALPARSLSGKPHDLSRPRGFVGCLPGTRLRPPPNSRLALGPGARVHPGAPLFASSGSRCVSVGRPRVGSTTTFLLSCVLRAVKVEAVPGCCVSFLDAQTPARTGPSPSAARGRRVLLTVYFRHKRIN